MNAKLPEYVALVEMEIHTAPGGHITIRPFGRGPNGKLALTPFHLVLTNEQAQQLAQEFRDAAEQSQEESTAARN